MVVDKLSLSAIKLTRVATAVASLYKPSVYVGQTYFLLSIAGKSRTRHLLCTRTLAGNLGLWSVTQTQVSTTKADAMKQE